MATKVTIGQKYGLPPFVEDRDYDTWYHEMKLWQLVTDLPKEKQGPVLFLSLTEKVRHACSSLTAEELNAADGIDKLLTRLKDLYGISAEQATFTAYESFETFTRPDTMTITDYINNFERLNQKLLQYKISLPEPVLAYQLLKNANLPREKRDLVRATISELSYKSMKTQIKAIYDMCVKSEKSNTDESIEIMVEPEQVMYGSRGGGYRGRFVKGSRGRGGNGRNTFGGNPSYGNAGNNGKQSNGNQWTQYRDSRKRCFICESVLHLADSCPDNPANKSKSPQQLNLQLFSEQSEVFFGTICQ